MGALERPRSQLIEDLPRVTLPENVHVHFYFTSHKTKEDLGDTNHLKRRLKDADIVAVELEGHEPDEEKRFNKIARGDFKTYTREKNAIKASKLENKGFWLGILSALYNSSSTLLIPDVPSGNSIAARRRRSMLNAASIYFAFDFDQVLERMDRYYREKSDIEREREQFVLPELSRKIGDVLQSNAHLQRKEKVQVVVVFGASHSRLFYALHSEYPDKITREFSRKPFAFDFVDQAIRAYDFGMIDKLEPHEKRLLLARVFAHDIVERLFDRFDPSILPEDLTREKISAVLAGLTFDEAKTWHHVMLHQGDRALISRFQELVDERA